jgi:Mor family transcriptional regulator
MALIWGRQSTWVLSEEQKQEICRRYEAGASMRTLAKRYGLRSHSAIHSIIRTQRKRRQART